MARHVRNPKLDSRTAREKLKPSGKPLYADLGNRLHLGYRKGKRGGSWVLRRYLGDEKYLVETIAEADDIADADGVNVLTYTQAQDAALERMKAGAEEARIASLGPIITVRDAIEDYVRARDERDIRYGVNQKGRKGNARGRLGKHVDEMLAAKPLATLRSDDLAKWRDNLQDMAPGTAQRTSNDLKAALNAAAKRAKAQLPSTIRDTIADGLAKTRAEPAKAREMQILPDADIRRLISAAWDVDASGGWEGDLGRIVLVLAATGARFSQVARMTVGDVQAAQRRLMVPVSRKGGGVRQTTHIGVRVGDDVLAALAPAIAGRKGHEPLFLRPHWRSVGVGRWEKAADRRPWLAASELIFIWTAIVAKAGLATGTIPYALRHSSIVRGLRAGLPTRLVAALHDTSSAMIEAHYAAFIVDAMNELAARAVVPLTTAPATVIPIGQARA
jgi:integrase